MKWPTGHLKILFYVMNKCFCFPTNCVESRTFFIISTISVADVSHHQGRRLFTWLARAPRGNMPRDRLQMQIEATFNLSPKVSRHHCFWALSNPFLLMINLEVILPTTKTKRYSNMPLRRNNLEDKSETHWHLYRDNFNNHNRSLYW